MTKYNVTGMTCAACAARVEKAVKGVSGVSGCAVSLLTNSMGVEGSAKPSEIIKAVSKAGYGASLASGGAASSAEPLADTETPKLKRRLIWSVCFLAVLMYFSMGHMLGLPLPAFMDGNHLMLGLLQMLLTIVVMVINQRFFISGFKGLINRAPNMDTLVALGSAAAFGYSAAVLFLMTDAVHKGDEASAARLMEELYFESAATILTLITVGKTLEARSKGKTTDALKSLMKLAPKTATVIRGGVETEMPVSEVTVGDVFTVRPGGHIPVDGKVVEGASAVDESALTGESIPVDKTVGSAVSAGTLNSSGFLKCEASRVGEDTALSQIIKMVSDAAATKAPIVKIADRVSGVFVPAVITVALITTVVWLLLGRGFGFALARGISVLVISCPCALGLATPVAIMVGNGVGAKNGILFKTAVSLEETGKAQTVVLDKTGTVTLGEPRVTDILPENGFSETELLKLACSLEKLSEHPLAKAIVGKCAELSIDELGAEKFEALSGNGLKGELGGKALIGGSLKFISENAEVPKSAVNAAEKLSESGKTPLLFSCGGKLAGIVAVADVIKPDSPSAIAELKNMGIKTVMLTGDNEKTAAAIGAQAGVDSVVAGVLPQGKEAVIRKLKALGRVVMVGDGINDAPALTSANVGMAIGAGTDVAIDAADVVLMHSRLSDAAAAIRLSRATLRIIHENLFWAFIYNVIGIPLAAGVFIPLGITLNPMFGAAAMSLSSFCVVTNALRLNLVNVHSPKRDRKIKNDMTLEFKEEKKMTKTIKIEGMMCEHCEATVKKALEAVKGVSSAEVSHTAGTAVVTLAADVSDSALKKAVEDKEYTVKGIE